MTETYFKKTERNSHIYCGIAFVFKIDHQQLLFKWTSRSVFSNPFATCHMRRIAIWIKIKMFKISLKKTDRFVRSIQIIRDTFWVFLDPLPLVSFGDTGSDPLVWRDNFHFTKKRNILRLSLWNLVQKWTKKWHVTFWLTPLPICNLVSLSRPSPP